MLFPEWFPYGLAAVLGLCIGSFLNVCIVRLPHDQSVMRPGSQCPRCHRPVRWFDNIPVLSFLLLRGRCRGCHAPISWRYPLVELLSGAMSVLTYWYFPTPLGWAIWFVLFIAPLIAITFIDLEHQIIPDALSISGIPLGLLARAVLAPKGMLWIEVLDGVIGIVVGGGFLLLVSVVYEKLRKQEGLGGGDVKLAAMFGAFLGWQGVIMVLLFSACLGSVVGLVTIAILRKNLQFAIPYGPFLAGAAVFYLFFGQDILHWYLGFFV